MVRFVFGLIVVYGFFGNDGRFLESNFRIKSCALMKLGGGGGVRRFILF